MAKYRTKVPESAQYTLSTYEAKVPEVVEVLVGSPFPKIRPAGVIAAGLALGNPPPMGGYI